jgi:hypothetical protein
MEIEKFSVKELTTEEQLMVNGGGKVADFFAGVWDAIKDAAEWIWENVTFTVSIEIAKNIKINFSN